MDPLEPHRVRALVVEDLPVGRVSRLLVELGHDGLGRAVRVPLLAVRGRRDGPVFGVTAALHGNELNGLPVVHRLTEQLEPGGLRGTVVCAPVLNIPGLLGSRREFRDGVDLNHVMPGRPDGNESQVYAHRLLDRVIRRFDYLVDLHTASFGRVNTLYVRADLDDAPTAHMAMLQRPALILHNPPSDHTLRGAAEDLGIPSITVEIGSPQVFQRQHIRRTLAGIRAVLAQTRMLAKRPMAMGPAPVICSRSRWLYTDMGGLLEVLPELGEVIEKDALIARQTDVFGDLVREYHAPVRGVVIGKSTNPVGPTGARILHLGTLAAPDQFPAVHTLGDGFGLGAGSPE